MNRWFLQGIACLLWAHSISAADDKVWQFHVDNFPPYIDQTQPKQGVLSQWVLAALEQAGVKGQLHFLPWSQVADASLAAHHASFMWLKTPDLEQHWLFSEPLLIMRQQLITLKKNTHLPDPIVRMGIYRIGVVADNPQLKPLQQYFPNAQISTGHSDYQMLQSLLQGQVDFILLDPIVAHVMLEHQTEIEAQLRVIATPQWAVQPLYLVCSRNYLPCQMLIKKFNQGLASVRQGPLAQQLFGIGAAAQ